jgi:hypothetical protein
MPVTARKWRCRVEGLIAASAASCSIRSGSAKWVRMKRIARPMCDSRLSARPTWRTSGPWGPHSSRHISSRS